MAQDIYNLHELKNGIRLIHRYSPSPVSHCGITINVGSRDESESENGIAHFIEHSIFKGTHKRKAFQILNRIDGVGGELNAFTTKEETCIYGCFLNSYNERFLELLSDIVFNSTFPEKEITKEKVVVIDEINSYEDTPSELIYDEFEKQLFGNHPLGRLILGTPDNVNSFTSEKIKSFIDKNYSTDQMVISIVSSIDSAKWFFLAEKYFGNQKKKINKTKREKPIIKKGVTNIYDRDTYQSHAVIGTTAYGYKDEKKAAFSLLNNMLGGWAMNSFLNMHIREKYGFTYTIESNYTAYSDVGVFSIYAGTDKKYMDKTLRLINKELERFTQSPLAEKTLLKFKQQMKGQLAISCDSNQNEMLSIGKMLLNFGKVDTLQDTYTTIDEISAKEILEVAQEIFVPEKLSIIQYI
ncbi:MAG: pitrilysin family protein [Bacteroidales bacterium]|nr:pitrilysin family protein [Bacteroidales bacterium]